jgi:endoglucanase
MKNRNHNLVLLFLLISLNIFAQSPFGVNLAGAEFGSNMPGTFNSDYTYPTASELDYYQSKNLNLIRLPFRWERIQPILNGNLDSNELMRLKSFVQLANNRNMEVIIDLHNYCRYKINGVYEIIGSNNLSVANITDLWTKLSLELKDEPNIWGYGIMNEPHDLLPNTSWFNIAQSIINGIRTNDQNTTIIVGGDSWSSAERWLQYSDNLKNLVDSSNDIVYEAHVYFDNDASGLYNDNYDNEGAYPNSGIDRVTPFVNWLNSNNLKGFIGEYGVPADDNRWLVVLDNFLNHLKQNCINGTYWAGGPWWGNYILSIEPNNNVDKPQMSILQNHIITTNCPPLGINEIINSSEIHLYPNPFIDSIHITGINDGTIIYIYDIKGRLITTKLLENSKIQNLNKLKSGVYIIKSNKQYIGKIIK